MRIFTGMTRPGSRASRTETRALPTASIRTLTEAAMSPGCGIWVTGAGRTGLSGRSAGYTTSTGSSATRKTLWRPSQPKSAGARDAWKEGCGWKKADAFLGFARNSFYAGACMGSLYFKKEQKMKLKDFVVGQDAYTVLEHPGRNQEDIYGTVKVIGIPSGLTDLQSAPSVPCAHKLRYLFSAGIVILREGSRTAHIIRALPCRLHTDGIEPHFQPSIKAVRCKRKEVYRKIVSWQNKRGHQPVSISDKFNGSGSLALALQYLYKSIDTSEGANRLLPYKIPSMPASQALLALAPASQCFYRADNFISPPSTSIRLSCLHFGQNKGKLWRTVSLFTFVFVLLWQMGQCTQPYLSIMRYYPFLKYIALSFRHCPLVQITISLPLHNLPEEHQFHSFQSILIFYDHSIKNRLRILFFYSKGR